MQTVLRRELVDRPPYAKASMGEIVVKIIVAGEQAAGTHFWKPGAEIGENRLVRMIGIDVGEVQAAIMKVACDFRRQTTMNLHPFTKFSRVTDRGLIIRLVLAIIGVVEIAIIGQAAPSIHQVQFAAPPGLQQLPRKVTPPNAHLHPFAKQARAVQQIAQLRSVQDSQLGRIFRQARQVFHQDAPSRLFHSCEMDQELVPIIEVNVSVKTPVRLLRRKELHLLANFRRSQRLADSRVVVKGPTVKLPHRQTVSQKAKRPGMIAGQKNA